MQKFLNKYNNTRRKEEFFTTQTLKEDLTDQSQITSASITAMANKFGIDALIAKAQKMNIESQTVLDKLYGNDFTNMFTSKEAMLNTKIKLNTLFDKLPAKMRKEVFNDNVVEFVNAYTTNNEQKLASLNKLGIIDDRQLLAVKQMNEAKRMAQIEANTKAKFIAELEKTQGALYENYKKTGNISINNNNIVSGSNSNLQENL